jgi:hypothetical protein
MSGNLSYRIGMLSSDQDLTARVRRVRPRRGKLTGVAVNTTTARATCVGEAELDGDVRDWLR